MIVVTGANGLLGSYVVRRLVEAKIPFVAMRRESSDISSLADINNIIQWVEGDITDPDSLIEIFSKATGVIHTAAVVSYHKQDGEIVKSINVEGTRNVVNACLITGIKRLLHVSSVAAIGKEKGQVYIDETSKWIEGAIVSNYATSKYQAELEVWRGQEEGLCTVIVNPSVILAPTDWDKSSAQLFKYAWQERPFFTDGSFSAVDVRDVATAIIKLYNSSIEAERFILTAETISYLDFFTKAANYFGKKPPSIRVNRKLIQFAARFDAFRSFLTRSRPLITKETAHLAGKNFTYSNIKVKKALGLEFQSIENTISWCCGEYRQKISLKK
ncbi:epimerase [Chryseotalea sanaruensis]|uniref:Epimerase n=1 Tax=Chryseotalea sanaruensis TaxID=2482724 RepID=A0A401UAS4_9BACT|nr:NAD-dependent epimerase/dehydratase family protein [Chryseotalea sanaruensis]GCC51990.1 epimerase [Chryseotalea sanaruensis]